MKKLLLMLPVLFFIGCDVDEQDRLNKKILRVNEALQQEHYNYHKQRGFDFSCPCSMCGYMNILTAKTKEKSDQENEVTSAHVSGVATGVMISNCSKCSGKH